MCSFTTKTRMKFTINHYHCDTNDLADLEHFFTALGDLPPPIFRLPHPQTRELLRVVNGLIAQDNTESAVTSQGAFGYGQVPQMGRESGSVQLVA